MNPIPTTLDEAVDQIVASMDGETKAGWRTQGVDACIGPIHHWGGMALRNDWGLWHGTTGISQWLRAQRVFHGDDASAVIFEAVWRRLRDLPIDDAWVAERAAYYETFWAKSGLTWDQQPIAGFTAPKSRLLKVSRKDGTTRVEDME